MAALAILGVVFVAFVLVSIGGLVMYIRNHWSR